MSTTNWVEAGGDSQIPFLAAASRALRREYPIQCPRCGQAMLRAYFHVFNREKGTGTLWVWCPSCHTTSHLPRVRPERDIFPDPFEDLSAEEFAALELGRQSLLDRLDRLWDEGKVGFPRQRS